MLNKTFTGPLLKEYQGHQTNRHNVIGQSNTALKSSKQAIFDMHRNDLTKARKTLDIVKKQLNDIQKKLVAKHPQLKYQGALLAAIEEYLEAELFYQALTAKKITSVKGVEANANSYIGAICDMTGELTRRAVLKATEKEYETVDLYFELVSDVVGALIQFDLTGHLRQKFDDAKRNLKRIEGIRYDISLRP